MNRFTVDSLSAMVFQAYHHSERYLTAVDPKQYSKGDLLIHVTLLFLVAYLTGWRISQGIYLTRDALLAIWSFRIGSDQR